MNDNDYAALSAYMAQFAGETKYEGKRYFVGDMLEKYIYERSKRRLLYYGEIITVTDVTDEGLTIQSRHFSLKGIPPKLVFEEVP